MTIKENLEKAIVMLNESKIEDSMLKAKLLLANCIKKPKEYLFIYQDQVIDINIEKEFFKKIKQLTKNVPLQYITNLQEFMGFKFYVDENVLIPRSDTEVLVEEVVKELKSVKKVDKVLELCTGSGVIAISLAKLVESIYITSLDISESTLNIARKNAKNNGVENRINFIRSNMFENITEKYDFIISNPPYIETDTIKFLNKDVQNEPKLALDGGVDGLDFYRIIAKNAKRFLNKNGKFFLEIGYNQKESVIEIFKKYFNNIICIKDLAGLDRVIIIK